jgi:putative transposase
LTFEQIVRILQEAQVRMWAPEVCRKHNVTAQSCYRRQAKYGGLGVIEVKRLKELERA